MKENTAQSVINKSKEFILFGILAGICIALIITMLGAIAYLIGNLLLQ